MNRNTKWIHVVALAGCLAAATPAVADTPIAVFDENFYLDGLFAWSDAVVVSTATGYSITDTGYGSGYKDINPNIDASGETNIELIVTVSGTPSLPDGPVSGPLVKIVDDDLTEWEYAWYGLTNGTHVLTAPLDPPRFVRANGSVPGLNLANLSFFHLQDDPGTYQGQYTIVFKSFRLTGATGPAITSQSYNPATKEFTLTWASKPGKSYTVLHAASLSQTFDPLQADILADSTSTTTTVTMPAGDAGYLRIQQQ